MNRTLLFQAPVWSPDDSNAPDATFWSLTDGDLTGDQNVSVNLMPLAGGDLPDKHVALIHAIEFMVGDLADTEMNPGDYTEFWLFNGYGSASPHHLGRWVSKLQDDDFLAHFRAGYAGIEDTASGTGGTDMPGTYGMWKPPAPVVSATGEISANWEGDGDENQANKGEVALRAWWTTQEVSDIEFFRALLSDR